MISEESCDTQKWSNVNWKFRFDIINCILKYNSYFKLVLFTILLFYCIFDQINAALVSLLLLKKNFKKSNWPQTFERYFCFTEERKLCRFKQYVGEEINEFLSELSL